MNNLAQQSGVSATGEYRLRQATRGGTQHKKSKALLSAAMDDSGINDRLQSED